MVCKIQFSRLSKAMALIQRQRQDEEQTIFPGPQTVSFIIKTVATAPLTPHHQLPKRLTSPLLGTRESYGRLGFNILSVSWDKPSFFVRCCQASPFGLVCVYGAGGGGGVSLANLHRARSILFPLTRTAVITAPA